MAEIRNTAYYFTSDELKALEELASRLKVAHRFEACGGFEGMRAWRVVFTQGDWRMTFVMPLWACGEGGPGVRDALAWAALTAGMFPYPRYRGLAAWCGEFGISRLDRLNNAEILRWYWLMGKKTDRKLQKMFMDGYAVLKALGLKAVDRMGSWPLSQY